MKKVFILLWMFMAFAAAFPCEATSIQSDPPSDDTIMALNVPDTNLNSLGFLHVFRHTGSQVQRSVLLINAPASPIPTNATVTGATLYLRYYDPNSGDPTGRVVDVHGLTTTFVEGEATWNSKSTGVAWDTAGGDYGADKASFVVPNGTSDDRWDTWTITSIVQTMVTAGQTEYGFLVKWADETVVASMGQLYRDSEYLAVPGERPYITIGFTTPSGITCPELTGTPLSCNGAGTPKYKGVSAGAGTPCYSGLGSCP